MLTHLLMPDTFMVTMDMDMLLAMPTMDTMDTHMPTTMDITMARGPLIPSPLLLLSPRLMLMPTTDTTDTLLPTTDTHMPVMDISMARGPLMLSLLLMLMLPMDIMDMDTILDMPTMDTMDTLMPTVVTSMVRYHH